MLPLRGITVVAIEQAVAAPFASRQLADLGARVIKIERPEGGDFARAYDGAVRGLSSQFVWLNRSKESLTLDLKRPQAKEILQRLLAKADVFLHNLAPGAVERMGFPAAGLKAAYPRLIVCELSGYGSSGPYRDKKAYDLLVQNEAGLVSITGMPDAPCKVGISIADIAAGMYAFSGILTAILSRSETGQGCAIEVSLFEALAEWMGYPMYYSHYGGTPPARTGDRHAVIAPYGAFMSGDNRVIYLGIQNEREWRGFCELVLGCPRLAADPRFETNSKRAEHVSELRQRIEAVFAELSASQIIDRLERARIAYGRLNTIPEFIAHPQLAARNRWREVDSPVGPLRALLPPVTIDDVDPRMGPIPSLGQHTRAILEELGYDAATIATWNREKMV